MFDVNILNGTNLIFYIHPQKLGNVGQNSFARKKEKKYLEISVNKVGNIDLRM